MKFPPILGALLVAGAAAPGALSAPPEPVLPEWVNHVGAMQTPSDSRVFDAGSYGALGDGTTVNTRAIQAAIDACSSAGGGLVRFRPGTFLTGAIFVKSRVHLLIDKGVTLLATTVDSSYPVIPTRVAGIEMPWPAALINVNGQEDVEISGDGTIDGQGEYWWQKYWTLRKGYEPRGIRWAADYDCRRVRLIVAFGSRDVTFAGLHLRRSGFWNLQVTYCDRVTVDGIRIADNGASGGIKGASTDGVDIDSSRRVLVKNCDIDNNDDDICLKAGRDFDGLRVNRATEYVVIRDNVCRRGGGVVSFGSETSGGIRHVVAYHDTGIGTSEGIRFKSARTRGGTVEDILILGLTLTNVPLAFTFDLDWNPQFSYGKIPPEITDYPDYWSVLTRKVEPPERGYVHFRDITIASVAATGARRILTAAGMPGNPLGAVRWQDIEAQGRQSGQVRDAAGWTMKNVRFVTDDGIPPGLVNCPNFETPTMARNQ